MNHPVVFYPAATKWVRNEEDARRYYETSATEIRVLSQGRSASLAEMDHDECEFWIETFLRRFREDGGWLPMTLADQAAAEELSRKLALPGETPIIGVQTDEGLVFQKQVGPRKR